jgi:hypothetical protein
MKQFNTLLYIVIVWKHVNKMDEDAKNIMFSQDKIHSKIYNPKLMGMMKMNLYI